MKGTYRCTNVKFCMEDENQCRAWEYLHSLSRKDGSYGKVLSDALIEVLDGDKKELERAPEMSTQGLAEETARIVLTGIKEQLEQALVPREADEALKPMKSLEDAPGDMASEDMLAFAFGIDE